jgi:glycosyltransferase involved in cell wall biosynthesis
MSLAMPPAMRRTSPRPCPVPCSSPCYDRALVRILLDYRSALRERTGAGEYAHNLAAALQSTLAPGDELTLFSSSWKDRLSHAVPGARHVDRRIPVRVLNYAWHRMKWPPVDWLAGAVDVTQSMHPAILPSRSGARFITIHDLYFLDHRDNTSGEVRRDYAALVAHHARRADGVVVPSEYTRSLMEPRLGVPADRVIVCPPGAPAWPVRVDSAVPGPILFVGSIEPRKNVGGLLQAYAELAVDKPDVPPLVLAGRTAPGCESLLAAIEVPPLRGRVHVLGYVSDQKRQQLYREASMLVLPSFDEGFGLPALEAMTIGTPVVVSRRGSLPEVVGDAGLLVDPDDHHTLTTAMAAVLSDELLRRRMARAGVQRARDFSWRTSARRLYAAYAAAAGGRRS